MPGRNHPHPERFEVKNPGFVSKMSDNLQGGFTSAKDGLISAKNKVWGPTIQPIEGGMPGRNHPHPELFQVKSQGFVSKITENLRGGFGSAKDDVKNKIWGHKSMEPIEGGMPGRYHPHPERFEVKEQSLASKIEESVRRILGDETTRAKMDEAVSNIKEEDDEEEEDEENLFPKSDSRSDSRSRSKSDVDTTLQEPTETGDQNQKNLVSTSQLAELFDMEPEHDTEPEIVDQTALEPSSQIVEETEQNKPTENIATPKKEGGFFSKLKQFLQ